MLGLSLLSELLLLCLLLLLTGLAVLSCLKWLGVSDWGNLWGSVEWVLGLAANNLWLSIPVGSLLLLWHFLLLCLWLVVKDVHLSLVAPVGVWGFVVDVVVDVVVVGVVSVGGVVSVNMGWYDMVVVSLMDVVTFFDQLWVRSGSGGNWHINVLGSVGHWLVIGVVGHMSDWLPVDVNLLVVDWLVLGLFSVVLVLWCWLVVVGSLVAVLFLDVCLWFWDLVVVSIELVGSLVVLLCDLGVSVVMVEVVVIGMMGVVLVVVNGWAGHWVIMVLFDVVLDVVHNWVGIDMVDIKVTDWSLVVWGLDVGVVAVVTVDGGLSWLVVDVVVDWLVSAEIIEVLLVLAPLFVLGAPLVGIFVLLMNLLLLLGKLGDLGLLGGNLSLEVSLVVSVGFVVKSGVVMGVVVVNLGKWANVFDSVVLSVVLTVVVGGDVVGSEDVMDGVSSVSDWGRAVSGVSEVV